LAKKNIEYINGKIPMPILSITRAPTEEERRAIREWRKKGNRVAGWLLAIVESHISKT
jgi:hypothetical protein